VTAPPLVSVIVPARNAAGVLKPLLRALEHQTMARDLYEVVVVDDGSTDETSDFVRASRVARLIRRALPGGSYAARNDGVAAARGRVLAFTDADAIPARDWLERGLGHVRSGHAMVAGHVDVPLGARPTAAALVDFVRFLDQRSCVAKGFAATANLWLDRDVLARVGLFNGRLRSGGDLEFGHRARAAGVAVVYAADVIVVHQPRRARWELARKGYRIGYANAEHRFYAEGELRARARICLQPGNYVPRRRLWGWQRLEDAGVALSRRQLVAMHVTQYLCLQLPTVFGSIVGSLRVRRPRVMSEGEPVAVVSEDAG
jgi:glycosyltransferase involved in cell wall biosynthesis